MSLYGPIVIIDDDDDEILLVKSVLESLAVPNIILTFPNGKEALNYLASTADTPFVILCDIAMPVMNGMELRASINADENLKKKTTPFIFRSGSVSREIIHQAYDLNVQGFFPKTMSYDELKTQIGLIMAYWKNCYEPNTIV